MDEAIRRVLKTDKPCPEVWKQLKTILANGKKKEDLVRKLKKQFTEA
jgi:DNA-binding FrmR family transcriptional regulator